MACSRKLGVILCLLLALPAIAADVAVLHNGFTIRHERRQVIGSMTRLYTSSTAADAYVDVPTTDIEHFEKDLSPAPAAVASPRSVTNNPSSGALPPTPTPVASSPQKMNDVVNSVSDRHHLDPDFISSVIRAESGFNTRAVSPKGARGLMQLMPQTATDLGVNNSFDPNANVEGGTRYLRELLERYNFDIVKALAAYNAGPQRVDRYRGVPPYYETRAYVARIIRDYNRKKLAEQKAAKSAAKASPRKISAKTAPAAAVPTDTPGSSAGAQGASR